MDSSSDVVCPDCGSRIIWETDEDDMLGNPGEEYPVDCAGSRCERPKNIGWAPIPRSDHQPA